ncbi:hypothetical protein B0T13DRAFT_272086 [Neurospora crassa]|nr:hypothetical protein B0T13DRAFT_159447 [Neurospora crassa]KAK3498642.1 hypothetical protein B0T13DRAFT_272086 [Neurospora crassa]
MYRRLCLATRLLVATALSSTADKCRANTQQRAGRYIWGALSRRSVLMLSLGGCLPCSEVHQTPVLDWRARRPIQRPSLN